MTRLRPESPEVLYCEGGDVAVSAADLADLVHRAAAAPRGRARLCAHRTPSERLHEMLIAVLRRSYVRPHRHLGRGESFHVVSGAATVLLFDDDGAPSGRIPLGEPGSGRTFFCRLDRPVFHALLVKSEALLVHETTLGPFDRRDTEQAPWAPGEGDAEAGRAFLARSLRLLEERP